ncbi:hypothetical protein LXL04_037970 [Taraxacum kok-saghyz]
MSSSRQLTFLIVCSCWWLLSNCNSISKIPQDGHGDGISPPPGCENCALCQYPCTPQPQQPPPPQLPGGSEIYTAPPPPEIPGGSDIYAAPPPPAPHVGVNCPPVAPVICCQNSPPMPYIYPNNGNFSDSADFSSSPCSLMLLLLLPFFVFLFHV